MLSTILGFFTSSAFGAITGIVGNWLKEREERENRKLEMQHEIAMTTLKHDQKIQLADKNLEITVEEGELAAFTESQKSDSGWMDRARAIVRPILTVWLVGVSCYITYKVNLLVGGMEEISVKELLELYSEIIMSIIFLTTTAVSWWFCSRPKHKK